jgi:hypothetical protein
MPKFKNPLDSLPLLLTAIVVKPIDGITHPRQKGRD